MQDGIVEGVEESKKAMGVMRHKLEAQLKLHAQDTEKQLNQVRTDMLRHVASIAHDWATQGTSIPTSDGPGAHGGARMGGGESMEPLQQDTPLSLPGHYAPSHMPQPTLQHMAQNGGYAQGQEGAAEARGLDEAEASAASSAGRELQAHTRAREQVSVNQNTAVVAGAGGARGMLWRWR